MTEFLVNFCNIKREILLFYEPMEIWIKWSKHTLFILLPSTLTFNNLNT